jgi:hypothetical protein
MHYGRSVECATYRSEMLGRCVSETHCVGQPTVTAPDLPDLIMCLNESYVGKHI